jgi:hypothetical protein
VIRAATLRTGVTTDDDMRGPWALALGMAGIALGVVSVSGARHLRRRAAERDRESDATRADGSETGVPGDDRPDDDRSDAADPSEDG